MRKGFFLGITCMFITALLTACGAAKTAPPQTVRFSCDFAAEYQDLQLEGTLQRLNVGTLSLSLTVPPSLSGMQISWDGEKATVAFHGLQYTMSAKLPQSAAARLMLETLDDACKRAADGALTKDGVALSGTVGAYRYELLSDAKDGSLVSLEVPDAALSVRFFNAKPIE